MFKKIRIFLRKLFQPKQEPSLEQQKWFDQCKPGDLIWAEMPLPKYKLRKIEKTHRVRPYFIALKNKKILVGLACSSKEYKWLDEAETCCLNEKEPLPKKTWINLKEDFHLKVKNLRSSPLEISKYKKAEIKSKLEKEIKI